MIYFDSAATTLQKPPSVARSAGNAVGTLSSPGRGGHPAAMAAAETAFNCRLKAAELFNMPDPENIVFTQNATHALNIAIQSAAWPGARVLVSGYEHNAVTRPLYAMGAATIIAEAPLFDQEAMLEAFLEKLTWGVSLVVCTHVSNVFGYILPIEQIAEACRARGIPLIIDASQSAGILDVDMQTLGADYIAMPGHKALYGPQGTGLLLCARVPAGIMQGGTGGNSLSAEMPDFLPDRLEAGTHNMPGIAGLMAGLDFVLRKGTERIRQYEETLITLAAERLAMIPNVHVFSAGDRRVQSGVLSFLVDGRSCDEVSERLARRGFAVRAGLHCAPTAHRTAGTLESGTVRMSVSAFNTRQEVLDFVSAVAKVSKIG